MLSPVENSVSHRSYCTDSVLSCTAANPTARLPKTSWSTSGQFLPEEGPHAGGTLLCSAGSAGATLLVHAGDDRRQPAYARRTIMDRHTQAPDISRRTFLTTASAALVGTALGGLAPQSQAAKRHPQRGGVLQFGMRNDVGGLDSHRHNQQHTAHATAAMYTGLT